MKKIILSATILSLSFAFGQKKEVAAAFKAIESGDVATANSQISAAEGMMGDKTYLLEPSVLEQYYFTKGVTLLKAGKTAEGATYLAKINDLGKSKIYTGKDASKNKVYFVGKSAADASGISNLKEETYAVTTSQKLAAILDPIVTASNKSAEEAYKSKNYPLAAEKFKESYNFLKAVGQNDRQLLYYSALSYTLAKDNNKALEIFKDLIASGYTGAETTYTAKEKATGKVLSMEKTTWEALKKASQDYTDFKTETTKSIEPELYETTATLLIDTEKYDEALAFLDKAVKKFPANSRLVELQSHTYYKSGKTSEFVNSLKTQLTKNPNDAVSWYNLGVLQSKDPATKTEAEANFRKALELNPKMNDAYQNLAYLLMGDDEKAINDYQSLRKAGKIDEANKVMDARRERFKLAVPVVEKWLSVAPDNLEVVSLLKGLYQTTHNDAKVKEMKAKEDALKAQGK